MHPAFLPAIVSLLLAVSIAEASAQTDTSDPKPNSSIAVSLAAIQSPLEKTALGLAVKVIPPSNISIDMPWDDHHAYTWNAVPYIDISGAGGDAFAHIRAQSILTREPRLTRSANEHGGAERNDVQMQAYLGYESDTDFNDASAYFGLGFAPVLWMHSLGNVPSDWAGSNSLFGFGANRADIFFEIGEKFSNPSLAAGGKIDLSPERAGDAIYRLKVDFNCVISLLPLKALPCSLDPDNAGETEIFIKTESTGYYNFRNGVMSPDLKAALGIELSGVGIDLWKQYRPTIYFQYEYGSGPPTFNRASQFSVNFSTTFGWDDFKKVIGCE